MSFKFALNELVEDKDGAVAKIVCRTEREVEGGSEFVYKIEFINGIDFSVEEKELKKTTKKEKTSYRGLTQEQLDEEQRIEEEKLEKRQKADKLVSAIKAVKNRYDGKCKDWQVFWQFFNEDVEKLVYEEMGAEKANSLLWGYTRDGVWWISCTDFSKCLTGTSSYNN